MNKDASKNLKVGDRVIVGLFCPISKDYLCKIVELVEIIEEIEEVVVISSTTNKLENVYFNLIIGIPIISEGEHYSLSIEEEKYLRTKSLRDFLTSDEYIKDRDEKEN